MPVCQRDRAPDQSIQAKDVKCVIADALPVQRANEKGGICTPPSHMGNDQIYLLAGAFFAAGLIGVFLTAVDFTASRAAISAVIGAAGL